MDIDQDDDGRDVRSDADSAEILAGLWLTWGEVCAGLSEEEWARATRCGDWNVAALAAHVSSGVGGMAALLDDRRVDGPADLRTAADLLRAVKPSAEVASRLAERVADQARDDGAESTSAELVERFRTGVALCERLRGQLHQSADYFGRGTSTLEAAVDLRIVEALVHILDLQEALGRPVDFPQDGMRITIAFLVDLVPPVAFIELATGRGTHDIFPVHS